MEMVHVIVGGGGGGGGLPPPLGSQVSPHWNLGPMPPGAWAAGTAVKLNVWLAGAGVGAVAAWAGAVAAAVASSPPPAVATAMAAAASAFLKRDIDCPPLLGNLLAVPGTGDTGTVGGRTETGLKRG